MIRALFFGSLFALSIASSSAFAVSDKQMDSVAKLGDLNGIALQCSYIEQVSKMKKAIVDNVPKVRAIGQTFDEQSNESFKAFVGKGEPCPPKTSFGMQVDAAIMELEVRFRK